MRPIAATALCAVLLSLAAPGAARAAAGMVSEYRAPAAGPRLTPPPQKAPAETPAPAASASAGPAGRMPPPPPTAPRNALPYSQVMGLPAAAAPVAGEKPPSPSLLPDMPAAGGMPEDDRAYGTYQLESPHFATRGRVRHGHDPRTGDRVTHVVPPPPPRAPQQGAIYVAPQIYPGGPGPFHPRMEYLPGHWGPHGEPHRHAHPAPVPRPAWRER